MRKLKLLGVGTQTETHLFLVRHHIFILKHVKPAGLGVVPEEAAAGFSTPVVETGNWSSISWVISVSGHDFLIILNSVKYQHVTK